MKYSDIWIKVTWNGKSITLPRGADFLKIILRIEKWEPEQTVFRWQPSDKTSKLDPRLEEFRDWLHFPDWTDVAHLNFRGGDVIVVKVSYACPQEIAA